MKSHLPATLITFIMPVVTNAGTGFITVVGEDPVALQTSVPSASTYKLDYDPERLSVWDTVTRDNLIAPDVEFMVAALKGDEEPDCDIDLEDFAGLQVCFGDGPLDPGCDAFDVEPDIDVDLTDFAAIQSSISGPDSCVPVTVTVYVEGLTASTSLGDAPVEVLADPDGDTTFTLQSTELVTVASITIFPSSGPAGTPLAIMLQPAISPLVFDSSTTLDWEGVFQPVVGSPTAQFQVAFDASQFRESSSSQAVVIVGDGTTTNGPDLENVEGPGTITGVLTFNFPSGTLTKSFEFAPELDTGKFEVVDYPDGPGGATPPAIGGEAASIHVFLLSNLPNPTNPSEAILIGANDFHVAVVVRIDENPETIATAPQMVMVDVASYDSGGAELDRIVDLMLTKVADPDRDPTSIVYHNDLTAPIVIVDTDLNDANYPNVVLLTASETGSVAIVPATN